MFPTVYRGERQFRSKARPVAHRATIAHRCRRLLALQSRKGSLRHFAHRIRRIIRTSNVRAKLYAIFMHRASTDLIVRRGTSPSILISLRGFLDGLIPRNGRCVRDARNPSSVPTRVHDILARASRAVPIIRKQLTLNA